MRVYSAVACALIVALGAPASYAAQPSRPHKAIAQPPAPGVACMDGQRLVTRAAFLPNAGEGVPQCSHLLSTDTLLTLHRHWDQT